MIDKATVNFRTDSVTERITGHGEQTVGTRPSLTTLIGERPLGTGGKRDRTGEGETRKEKERGREAGDEVEADECRLTG